MKTLLLRFVVLAMGLLTAQSLFSQEIIIPFTGKDYKSNESFLRVVQSGKSPDVSMAKQIAMQNAKEEMAGLLESVVLSTTKQYILQLEGNDDISSTRIKTEVDNHNIESHTNSNIGFVKLFESMSTTLVNQTLKNMSVMDEKPIKDGKNVVYWLVLEIPKEKVEAVVEKSLDAAQEVYNSNHTNDNANTDEEQVLNDKDQLDFDKEAFMKIFEAEMAK